MKTVSRAAVLAALAAGAATLAPVGPVQAKDKKPAATTTGPDLKLGAKVREALMAATTAYEPVPPAARGLSAAVEAKRAGTAGAQAQLAAAQATLQAALAGLEPSIAALEATAKTNDELYVAQEYRYRKESLSIAAQYPDDVAARSAAGVRLAPYLDRLLANPVTPQSPASGYATVADYALERGRIARTAREYAKAATFFERAQAAGSTDPNLRALIADVKINGGDLNGALASIESDIAALQAAGKPVPIEYYDVPIERLYRAKDPRSLVWEQRRVAAFPTPKNWHDAILRWGFNGRGPTLTSKQEMDLFRLMRASKALADEAEYRRYARAALSDGLANETKSVLEEGIATGKLVRTAPDVAVMLTPATAKAASPATLRKYESEARAGNASAAEVGGNFLLAAGDYAKAAELYQLAATRGPADRDTLMTHLGIAQALSGDTAGANASFAAVAGSPRKDVASWWLTWLSVKP